MRRNGIFHRGTNTAIGIFGSAAGIVGSVQDDLSDRDAYSCPSSARLDGDQYLGIHQVRKHSFYGSVSRSRDGTRYRSLGCAPCTFPIKSTAKTVDDIIEELRHTTVAERAGRAQDEGRGMELLRKDGYM